MTYFYLSLLFAFSTIGLIVYAFTDDWYDVLIGAVSLGGLTFAVGLLGKEIIYAYQEKQQV